MKVPTPASVWEELEMESRGARPSNNRLLRALGASAVGIRAGYFPSTETIELLLEVPQGWSGDKVIPKWRGMSYEIIDLSLPPRRDTPHLRLFLLNQEHREIFILVCEDLVTALEGISNPGTRVKEIEACLLRWRRFFEQSGTDGLGLEMQQGLFAELTWLHHMLIADFDPIKSVDSWKGCERGYHDFDLSGHVVEVKSTRTKEPLSVTISNELQLDDRDLDSLHLYALSLHLADGGGMTLPDRVEGIRSILGPFPAAFDLLRGKLVSAGYLDTHSGLYTKHFIIRSENLYRVVEGFPRIITVPPGVGGLKYLVLLASCEAFRDNVDSYLAELRRPNNEL